MMRYFDDTLDIYTYRVPDYWTFDAFVERGFQPEFRSRVNVTNIGNEDYHLAGYRSGHFLYKGDERRATLTLTGKF